jgi:glycerol kinase
MGHWTISDVRDAWRERRRYEPAMGEDERATLLEGWRGALARARSGA